MVQNDKNFMEGVGNPGYLQAIFVKISKIWALRNSFHEISVSVSGTTGFICLENHNEPLD
jgi:hypothetical protein